MTAPEGVHIIPLHTGLIAQGDDLVERLAAAWDAAGGPPIPGDVLAVASKVVALTEGSVVDLSTVDPSARAEDLSTLTGLPAPFCEVVIQASDRVLGGVPGAILTLAGGVLVANAGADLSNAPSGHTILWPSDAWRAAAEIREALGLRGVEGVAVVVVDSRVQPLRYGTVGLALGWAGLPGVEDVRGKHDLQGRPLNVTRRNVADMVASTASLVMGEADEATPAAIVRGLDVEPPAEGEQGPADVVLAPEDCLFRGVYEGRLLGGDRGGDGQ